MMSNRFIRNLLVLLTIITVLLIVPASFALESNATDSNQDISAVEMENQILGDGEKYDAIYVNGDSGDDSGTGTSDKPLKTIREGVNHVSDGGTLYLNGTFSGNGNYNLTLEAAPDNVTFMGIGNAIIDGKYANSFATVSKGNYTFSNIAFVNHYKFEDETDGGAINNLEGTLTFKDCLFENNSIYGINKAHGGAIANTGEVTLINTTFTNNVANVSNSSGFRKNSADGGAISNLGTLNVYDSSFIENKALRNGGAIRTQDRSNTYITNSRFIGNVAAYHLSGGSYGGAIYTWDCGLELYNSTFKNNRVYDASGYGGRGGALSLNRGIGKIFIYSCEFINNTADGIATVDGQSLCFESVEANVNYCTIDTSIYSISQSIDLNYNWWAVNDTNINALIENLPSSAAVKTFAVLKISSDMEKLEIGKPINVFVDLCWNGTGNQNNIDLIPLKTLYLSSEGGVLADTQGEFVNGSFKTTFTPASEDILVTVNVSNIIFKSNLNESDDLKIEITADDIFVGETGIISVKSDSSRLDFCLVDINNATYYAKLTDGNGNVRIPGLGVGKYSADLRFFTKNSELINETSTTLTVNEKLDSKMNATTKEAIDVNDTLTVNVELVKEASGDIDFYLDGVKVSSSKIKDGTAIFKLEGTSYGLHCIEVKYAGDKTFREESIAKAVLITNLKKDTKVEVDKSSTLAASDTGAGEKGGYIYATLKDSDNNPLANKTVQIALNDKIYDVVTGDDGKAELQASIASANTYTCAISFNGDDGYNPASLVCTQLKVTKKSTSISASAKTFKAKAKTKSVSATLKTSKNKLDGKTYLSKGKKLTLTVNKKTYTAKTNSKGVAKFTIKLTKKGKYTATIKFAGDNTYKASSKKIKITIK